MLKLSNLHGLRQRLNNRLQMYKTFLKFSKQFYIKYDEIFNPFFDSDLIFPSTSHQIQFTCEFYFCTNIKSDNKNFDNSLIYNF